jgi:hypothetical protein
MFLSLSLSLSLLALQVTNSSLPLTVTIVWNDPPNVMWATKNLLHDLDLTVSLPPSTGDNTSTTEHFYGNNIRGDEFNPCERVRIEAPSVGVYEVQVMAHLLPDLSSSEQQYSIVISSQGRVLEDRTTIEPISAKNEISTHKPQQCPDSADGITQEMMRFQLEDWQAGDSWNNQPLFVIAKNTNDPFDAQPESAEEYLHNCTFSPNSETQMSASNRIQQCAVCLERGASYSLFLDTDAAFNHSSHLIRVSSQCNNVFLSEFMQHTTLDISSDGECNVCSDATHSEVEVLMMSSVKDDDYVEYSWHGAAHYTIRHSSGE